MHTTSRRFDCQTIGMAYVGGLARKQFFSPKSDQRSFQEIHCTLILSDTMLLSRCVPSVIPAGNLSNKEIVSVVVVAGKCR